MEYHTLFRKHIEEIVPLTDNEFVQIASFFKFNKIKRKDVIIKEGQRVNFEYWVIKGLLKSFLVDDFGKEHIVQFAMENWWISDYASYKNCSKGEIYVQALEDTFVLELKYEDRIKLCKDIAKMNEFFATKTFGGFVALQKRVTSLLKNSALEKYNLLLEQYPALFQRVSKTMIAQYLGVSRETLSRLGK